MAGILGWSNSRHLSGPTDCSLVSTIVRLVSGVSVREGIQMSRTMTDSEKLDYLVEMVESLQEDNEQFKEAISEMDEKLIEIGNNYGDGFEREFS